MLPDASCKVDEMESYVDISTLQMSSYYIITDNRSFSTADNTLYRHNFTTCVTSSTSGSIALEIADHQPVKRQL